MKDRCPKSVGDAKQTLEIRVEPIRAVRANRMNFVPILCTSFWSIEII